MAKIRVFELARDLNMTTKELMVKLEEMEVEVSSHMSSLEDDAVSRVKGVLFSQKTPDVEETRIRPTVIRRRRKASKEPEAPSPRRLRVLPRKSRFRNRLPSRSRKPFPPPRKRRRRSKRKSRRLQSGNVPRSRPPRL
jgi:translation initiation factor IF-2